VSKPNMDDLLPTKQMVNYCHRSDRWLQTQASRGRLTKRYVGNRVYWSKAEVDSLVTTERPDGVVRSVTAMRRAREVRCDWDPLSHPPAPQEVVDRINRIAAPGLSAGDQA
jgi:hypothetical protein